jgi:GNAT superfamily N-acetyltransferase
VTLSNMCAKLSETTLELRTSEGKLVQALTMRPAMGQDRNFILGTWMRSYPAPTLGAPAAVVRAGEAALSEQLWSLSSVLVAEDDYTILGWACGRPGELYAVYVVPELRGIGVGRELIGSFREPGRPLDLLRPWPGRPLANSRYNPYCLYMRDSGRKEE